jgi:ATP-binding cassette, subfamily C (CFTR/MRP), member 10
VNVAFFAGVAIILIMIPLNRFIAVRIGTATEQLMRHKDARVKLVAECVKGIKSIKMSGLEDVMVGLTLAHREKEILYLSRRKYLDSWCVFLWASLPLMVPYVTFVTTVSILDHPLTASQVFTTVALLNMLIFPMVGINHDVFSYCILELHINLFNFCSNIFHVTNTPTLLSFLPSPPFLPPLCRMPIHGL